MNEAYAIKILKAFLDCGGQEICICPGSRNAPFVSLLASQREIRVYTGYEERSMSFFAMGRSRLTQRPVAIITTTGTASAELLPAIMESHYLGIPLIAITADRPRRFRGTGAPQTCEQFGLFGLYVSLALDIEINEEFSLDDWDRSSPIQLNVCMDEPLTCDYSSYQFPSPIKKIENFCRQKSKYEDPCEEIHRFLMATKNLLVIVSALKPDARQGVAEFLLQVQAPVYLEATSGLRENPHLQTLRVHRTLNILEAAAAANYPVDSVLRIGGVPTLRLWRDLEKLQGNIRVCSINDVPFPGLSWGTINTVSLSSFFQQLKLQHRLYNESSSHWLQDEYEYREALLGLFKEEPSAEASLLYGLSCEIPRRSTVFLGNSLPVREWDLAASQRSFEVYASRGVNGIDGQLSTFFGVCCPFRSNWGIFGDLTTLYDMAGPWILTQLETNNIQIVVVNNGGGQIFSRMYREKEFLNGHSLNFKPFAEMWRLDYERWDEVGECKAREPRLIEVVPDQVSTQRFWEKFSVLREKNYVAT